MKKSFLAVYDYGTGGVWVVINARSPEEIVQKYPQLKIVEERPGWMTDDDHKAIAANFTFDIDDPPTGWLLTMVTQG